MSDAPTHYFNFKPCDDVVQYDGTWSSLGPLAEWFEEASYVYSMNDQRIVEVVFHPWDSARRSICVEASPGQWLIRQDGEMWAQDEEPAKVKSIRHNPHMWICRDNPCPKDTYTIKLNNGWALTGKEQP